jgi:spore coat protein U-like protein
MKRLIIAALAASTVAVATPALAASVHFNGKVPVKCSISGETGTIQFGTLGTNGAASPVSTGTVTVFCNQPYTATISSANGYLKLKTSKTSNDSLTESNFTSRGNPQFDAGLDYGIVLPGIGTVGSQFITAGANNGLTTPEIPATNVSGSASYSTIPGQLPLLGGTYSDTVTVTLHTDGV